MIKTRNLTRFSLLLIAFVAIAFFVILRSSFGEAGDHIDDSARINSGEYVESPKFLIADCEIWTLADEMLVFSDGQGPLFDGLVVELAGARYPGNLIEYRIFLTDPNFDERDLVTIASELSMPEAELVNSTIHAGLQIADFVDEETDLYARWSFKEVDGLQFGILGVTYLYQGDAWQLAQADVGYMLDALQTENCDRLR